MSPIDAIGYLAASLVFTTFYMRSMGALRVFAVASNLCFLAYGYLGELMPVIMLHAGLLPLNVYRALQLVPNGWRVSIGLFSALLRARLDKWSAVLKSTPK